MLVSIQEYARASQEQQIAYFRLVRAAGEAILKNGTAFFQDIWHAIYGLVATARWGAFFANAAATKVQEDSSLGGRFDVLLGTVANHSGQIMGGGGALHGKAYITNASTYALANLRGYNYELLGPKFVTHALSMANVLVQVLSQTYKNLSTGFPFG